MGSGTQSDMIKTGSIVEDKLKGEETKRREASWETWLKLESISRNGKIFESY